MDYGKLDAGLASALDDIGDDDRPRLPVFVHIDPDRAQDARDVLATLGVTGSLQGGIATATLSPGQVRQLSDRPEVRQLGLATPLQLLE